MSTTTITTTTTQSPARIAPEAPTPAPQRPSVWKQGVGAAVVA